MIGMSKNRLAVGLAMTLCMLLLSPVHAQEPKDQSPKPDPTNELQKQFTKELDTIINGMMKSEKSEQTPEDVKYLERDFKNLVADYLKRDSKPSSQKDKQLIITLPPDFFEKPGEPKQQFAFPDPRKKQPCAPTGLSNIQVAKQAGERGKALKENKLSIDQIQEKIETLRKQHDQLATEVALHDEMIGYLAKKNDRLQANSANVIKVDGNLLTMSQYKTVRIAGWDLYAEDLTSTVTLRFDDQAVRELQSPEKKKNYFMLGKINKMVTIQYAKLKQKKADLANVVSELKELRNLRDAEIKKRDKNIKFMTDLLKGCGANPQYSTVSD